MLTAGPDRTRRGRVASALAAITAAVALLGCGADSGSLGPEPGTPGLAELLYYLPPDAAQAAFVNVASTRSQLGLPADADPLDVARLEDGSTSVDPEGRLQQTVALAFPPLSAYVVRFELPPSAGAFDGTQIQGVATAGAGSGMVSTLSTSQSFEEISSALEERGFEREGDAMVAGADAGSDPVQSVAQVDDGTIILAGSRGLAARVAAAPRQLEGPAALLAGQNGSTLMAVDGMPGSCLNGFGVGLGPAGASGDGVLVLNVEADPDPKRFVAPVGASASLEFEVPQVSAHSLVVPFEATPGSPDVTTQGLELVRTLAPLEAYRCG